MPKILGNNLADHRDLTRRRLFASLRELMGEYPFESITMKQIAAHAGVGRTAIYNHFGDKEIMLLGLMEQSTAEFADLLNESLARCSDPVARLGIYVRAHLEITDEFHLTPGIDLRQQVSHQTGPQLHEHAKMIAKVLRSILEDAMAAGRIPRQDIGLLITLIHSTLAGHKLPTHKPSRQALIGIIQSFVLRGVGVPANEIPGGMLASPSPDEAAPSGSEAGSHSRVGVDSSSSDTAFMRCPVVH